MGTKRELPYEPDYAVPPGDTLLETIEALGMTQVDLAERTGRPPKTINGIIKGKEAITSRTALELERVLGIPASFWNNLERNYRDALARIEEREHLQKQVEWLKTLPIAAMIRQGWVRPVKDKVEQIRETLNFFGVASPGQWQQIWLQPQAVFRQSPAFQCEPGAVAAWLRKGELDAKDIACSPYDETGFREALAKIRSLTKEPLENLLPEMIRLCAAAGVALVFVPELPKTRASGATRWLSPTKALIQLSFLYKTDDHLLFTFFHEAAHLLLHGKRDVFIESDGNGDGKEQEANRFASDFLIPPPDYQKLRRRVSRSAGEIRALANEIGIAPGILVGRLQYEKLIPQDHLNGLKRHVEWK